MGNCTSDFIDVKHSAAENLQTLFQSCTQESPLAFIIKEWPDKKNIDLNSLGQAVSRTLDLNLYPGEKVNITLKNHKKSLREIKDVNESPSPSSALCSMHPLHCHISRNNKFYEITFPVQKQRQYLWRYTHGWTQLKEGDVLRMGVTKYKLRKLVIHSQDEFKDMQGGLQPKESSKDISAPRCRICLSTVDTVQNPFISPCQCSGSIKFTHLRCLASWLFSSSLNQTQVLSIRSSQSVCQLCKTDITNTAEFQQMQSLLLGNLHDAALPYAVFEYNHYQQQGPQAKNYFVISFSRKTIYTLGRGTKADISDLNDSHISKINTELRYAADGLFVRDCESLHGTFVQVNDPIRLYPSNVSEELAYHNMLFRIVYQPTKEGELQVLPQINLQSAASQ